MTSDRLVGTYLMCGRTCSAYVAIASLIWAGLSSPVIAQLNSTQKADIGFTALQDLLGGSMPLGTGVSVSIVEAATSTGGPYRIDTTNAQLGSKTYQFPSGGNTTASGHATTVARYLAGMQSLAPHVGATADGSNVANYEANNWISSGYLNATNTAALPLVESRKLVNHSWVGSSGNLTVDTDILVRADFAVQRDRTIATYALNNGSATPIPNLMASTYNGIVVGLSSGNHSQGTTTINGSGRQKPDIVVPTEFTSWAAPTVSSGAAILVEVSNTTPGLANGQRPQVAKSLLMAGATKEGDNLPVSWSWSNTSTQPLDPVYGAGQLNILSSYQVLTSGEFDASDSTLASAVGWDFGIANATTSQLYFFDVGPGLDGGILTASLNWQRSIIATDTAPGAPVDYSFSTSLANLDLKLHSASGFSLGSLVSESVSTIDNTELLWVKGLSTGRYALEVTSNTTGIDFGIAWVTAVPEPSTWVLLAVAAAGAAWARRRWPGTE